MTAEKSDSADPPTTEQPPSDPPPQSIASADLLRGQRELIIRHGDEVYRLRLTRNGKLILHK